MESHGKLDRDLRRTGGLFSYYVEDHYMELIMGM